MNSESFSLTIKQLERLIQKASDDEMDDVLKFTLKDNRLIVTQKDLGHIKSVEVMNKPYK